MPANRVPDAMAPAELRSTQLYLNAGKLAAVLERVDGSDGGNGGDGDETAFDPGPLPVYEFDGDLHLTDGHTRAFVAYLAGVERVAVEYDADLAAKHDLALYRECVDWCDEVGVERVPDLAGRVLAPDAYEREWIDRCHRTAERLENS